MSTRRRAACAALIALGAASFASAAANQKMLVEAGQNSRVQFVSDAPLEKITGVGGNVTGQLEFDPNDIKNATGRIELAVSSIRTGIDLRDEHLRSDSWLDAAKYPTVRFDLAGVEGATKLAENQSVDVKVRGKLSMHGVTRDETATAKLRWIPGKGLKVQAKFKVNIQNYKVSVPSLVRLKVSDEIELNVSLMVSPDGKAGN